MLRLAALALLACAGCARPDERMMSTHDTPLEQPAPPPARPEEPPAAELPREPRLFDVSGDDCTASALIYASPPAPRVAFVNDGCFGERIFLGVDGVRRELTRSQNVPLGEGGEYSGGGWRAVVSRGRRLSRSGGSPADDDECAGDGEHEYLLVYEVTVRVRDAARELVIPGTLEQTECAP
jgi:hypothetical protein